YNYWLSLPQAFFADSLVKAYDPSFASQTKKIATVDSLSWTELGRLRFSNEGNSIRCTQFDPEKIVYVTECRNTSAFSTQQNYTSLWKVEINGKPVKVYYCFNSFPLVIVPPGKNTIAFTYEVPYFHVAFIISCLLFSSLIIIILLRSDNKKMRYVLVAIFIGTLIYCIGSYFYGKSKTIQSAYPKAIQQLSDYAKENGAKALQLVNGQDEISNFVKPGMRSFNLLFREDLAELCETLKKTREDKFAYLRFGGYHSVEAETLINYYYGKPLTCKKLDFGEITIYERAPQTDLLKYENRLNMETVECGTCKIRDSISGVVRLVVDKTHEFSPGFAFTLAEAKAESYDMLVAECELETDLPDFIGLCISIEHKGVIKKFPAYNYVHYPGKKTQGICLPYRLLASYKKDDLVKVYVWNNSERPVYLKELSIKVLKVK
ncbi:MAG: hypothetical protein ACJ76F_00575, partial [Bacteroidia bacterium]